MKLSLGFVFVTIVAVCMAAGQSQPGNQSASTMSHDSPATTQDQISNGPVAEYISASNCTIGWSASTPGTMTVRYGTDRTKMTKTAEAVASKEGRNYHVRLDGLKPSTRYYFLVMDAGEPISGVGTFETVAQGDAPIRSKATIPQ